MALSLSVRQPGQQMPTTDGARQQRSLQATATATAAHHTQQPATAAHLRLQKQHSFTEANRAQHIGGGSGHLLASRRAGSGYLTRGLSVDRSLESIRQKLATTTKTSTVHETQSKRLNKSSKIGSEKLKGIKTLKNAEGKYSCVRAGSTSSLLKSLDNELKQVNGQLGQQYKCNSVCDSANINNKTGPSSFSRKSNSPPPASEHQRNIANSSSPLKSDSKKVNLSIVLSHALNYRPINGNESNNSDIESSSESTEPNRKTTSSARTLCTDLPARANVSAASASATAIATSTSTITANATVQQRRAQFRSSRNITVNTSTSIASVPPTASNAILLNNQNEPEIVPSSANNTTGTLNAAPSLIVQRRPPLVRAMSAPVRSRSIDENSKGVFAFQKRKLRRRKLISRNPSVCEKSEAPVGGADKNDILFDLNAISGKKQPISRGRSTLAVDVITLVSLVSSEGSDSEKEDSAPETNRGNSERSRSTGMPSLRKTGKSVSFQENYPPNFQLATKEYSHMIRRGSIAPLAARLRSNRPPTAPPVSIFMNESNTNNAMPTTASKNFGSNSSADFNANTCNASTVMQNAKNAATDLTCDAKQSEEYSYPDYVRSLKERECWKLYRKMSVKGVSVSYETVLRGMLTPTEFRQIQKQREIEEAKARALEEEKDAALEMQPPISAVDRLTQKLLKK